MIPELSATRFSKVMGSGRTQPCLMVCEDEAGEVVRERGNKYFVLTEDAD